MRKKVLFRWLKIIIILYCGIGISLYYLQEQFLFHPVKLGPGYHYQFSVPFREVNIPVNATDTLNMIQFLPADSLHRGVVLYYHGNMENINHYAGFARFFTSRGYEVWMEDYPGFGKSTGTITEQKLYDQAKQVYKMANARYPKEHIIVYGKSFGTGIAAYVASMMDCRRLILETPYYSIPSLYSCYAPVYPTARMASFKIPTYRFVEETSCPVTIFHGTSDGVVPYRCAAKLKSVLKTGDEFITIPGGNHQNLAGYPVYEKKIDSLLAF
ncbi:MAG: alpha/beta fold hydrolase [Ferruginibacter sp.]